MLVVRQSFVDAWRRAKCQAFSLEHNSTARRTVALDFFGQPVQVYANANLSIYSAQTCNAKCPFCVEELRPASRGTELLRQKQIEPDDDRYFAALDQTLLALRPLNPSVSITGGEASKDPRLPRILETLARHGARKRTLTTNGTGLLDLHGGRPLVDWLTQTGLQYLNISRAAPDTARNAKLMRLPESPTIEQLQSSVQRLNSAAANPPRVRLSCVLLQEATHDLASMVQYLDFAAGLGIDNVIFRQLMQTDPATVEPNYVVRYSDQQRVPLEPLLDAISADDRFTFVRQIVGYYYYVEVWRYGDLDVVFEEADLAQLERTKQREPGLIHELVFHPSGQLASTWQPWDGVLGPPARW